MKMLACCRKYKHKKKFKTEVLKAMEEAEKGIGIIQINDLETYLKTMREWAAPLPPKPKRKKVAVSSK